MYFKRMKKTKLNQYRLKKLKNTGPHHKSSNLKTGSYDFELWQFQFDVNDIEERIPKFKIIR